MKLNPPQLKSAWDVSSSVLSQGRLLALVQWINRVAANEVAHDTHGHSEYPHESPWTMTLPLVALAVPSMLIGLVGTPFANYFEAFIYPPNETAMEL